VETKEQSSRSIASSHLHRLLAIIADVDITAIIVVRSLRGSSPRSQYRGTPPS